MRELKYQFTEDSLLFMGGNAWGDFVDTWEFPLLRGLGNVLIPILFVLFIIWFLLIINWKASITLIVIYIIAELCTMWGWKPS